MSSIPITEQSNERTSNISALPVVEILRLMNEEDHLVPRAVERVLGDIAAAVDAIVSQLKDGGRLFYIGTGTSGRLGVLDASECPPTFGVSPELIQGIIAGGYEALYRAVEASEDDRGAGADDLRARGISGNDAVVGLAASGRTPYTIGALEYARSLGSKTISITCVPSAPITEVAEINIVPVVGPEVLTGSTRLKAGSAQKMVLNMISTATLIRLGYVSGNRMSNVQTRNSKLRDRAVRILSAETDLQPDYAKDLLEKAGWQLPVAIIMYRAGVAREQAEAAWKSGNGVIDKAIAELVERTNS